MSLLDDARKALSRLRDADGVRTGLQEAMILDGLRSTLENQHTALRAVVERGRFLASKDIPYEVGTDVGRIKKSVDTLASQFQKTPSSATLKKGSRWTGLVDALEQLHSAVSAQQQKAWRTYCNNHLFSGQAPNDIRMRVAQTPGNTSALARYEQVFKQFAESLRRIPASDAEFEEAQRLSSALEQIKFDENVPAAVAAFLSAAAAGSGAALGLLTPEVFDWLRGNALLDRYVVRGRAI